MCLGSFSAYLLRQQILTFHPEVAKVATKPAGGGRGACFLGHSLSLSVLQLLEKSLRDFGQPWELNPGDGAFYGPKVSECLFPLTPLLHNDSPFLLARQQKEWPFP